MSISFSVVIPTLDRTVLLRLALASLCRTSPPPREVLVVDAAGSARAIADSIADAAPFELVYVRSEPGLTRQRNRGIGRAAGDVLVFLDDDVTVDRNIFAELAAAYADARIVGATGRVVEPSDRRRGGARSPLRRLLLGDKADGTFTNFGYPRRIQPGDAPCDVETMPGCFMSARREVAATVWFDERLRGYALAEDEDFSVRLARVGRIRYLPKALVYHRNTGFSSRDSRSFNRAVMQNRRYLFRKNFPQTRRARAGFASLALALLLHRAINRDFRGLRGLLEGAVAPLPIR